MPPVSVAWAVWPVWLWRTGRDLNSLNGSNSEERNRVLVKLGKGALEALDIELEAGIQPEHGDSCGTLVVANHVSWLDILLLVQFTRAVLLPNRKSAVGRFWEGWVKMQVQFHQPQFPT